jgi:hypothetical protein
MRGRRIATAVAPAQGGNRLALSRMARQAGIEWHSLRTARSFIRGVPMKSRSGVVLAACLLALPMGVLANPPGGNPGHGTAGAGHGHAPGNPGKRHGNGSDGGSDETGAGGKPDHGDHGGKGHGQGGGGQGDDADDAGAPGVSNGGDEDAAGAQRGAEHGQGHSQGPLHANPQAIASVCKHQAAASHSALGVNCGNGVMASVDPKTGVTSYSQAGATDPAAASDATKGATPRPQSQP